MTPAHDAAATYWALAAALEPDAFDLDAARAAFEATALPEDLRAAIASLAPRADRWARSAEQWRAPRDRMRAGRRIVAEAARRLADAASLPAPTSPADEAFHLRASLFGHLVAELSPIVDALRDRAVRLLVARVVDVEPHPLALVETMFRAHGLEALSRS